MNVEEFRDVLMRSYPKLREAGGFFVMQVPSKLKEFKRIPPLGFDSEAPSIVFLHDSKSRFPTASTCSIQLRLPISHGD